MGADLRMDGLSEHVQSSVRRLGDLLVGLAGKNLRALTLYGLAVVPEKPMAGEPIHSVAVLGGMDLLLLDQIRRAGPRLGGRLRAPLIMTPRYIDESLDAFPLEMLEIQHLGRTVYGSDYFAGLQFEPRLMRLQAERDLKRGLIHLRQGLLTSAGSDRALRVICRDAFSHILRVLRGLTWLRGKTCPVHPLDALKTIEDLTGIDLSGLRDAWNGSARCDFVWFQRFYRDTERLSDYVNGIKI